MSSTTVLLLLSSLFSLLKVSPKMSIEYPNAQHRWLKLKHREDECIALAPSLEFEVISVADEFKFELIVHLC